MIYREMKVRVILVCIKVQNFNRNLILKTKIYDLKEEEVYKIGIVRNNILDTHVYKRDNKDLKDEKDYFYVEGNEMGKIDYEVHTENQTLILKVNTILMD